MLIYLQLFSFLLKSYSKLELYLITQILSVCVCDCICYIIINFILFCFSLKKKKKIDNNHLILLFSVSYLFLCNFHCYFFHQFSVLIKIIFYFRIKQIKLIDFTQTHTHTHREEKNNQNIFWMCFIGKCSVYLCKKK